MIISRIIGNFDYTLTPDFNSVSNQSDLDLKKPDNSINIRGYLKLNLNCKVKFYGNLTNFFDKILNFFNFFKFKFRIISKLEFLNNYFMFCEQFCFVKVSKKMRS